MKAIVTILLALVIGFSFSSFSMAEVIESTEESVPETGGSGGGSSIPVPVSPRIMASINVPGFDAYASAGNEEVWFHSWVDKYTGKEEGHWHEKNAHGGIDFMLEQGAFGRHWLPLWSDIDIRRYDDQGHFGINGEFVLLAVDEKPEWQDLPSSNVNFNLFGLNYNVSALIRHDMHGYWDEEKQEWYEVQTSDVRGHLWFNFENAEVTDARLSVSSHNHWYEEGRYDGMRIEGFFDVIYTGSPSVLETLNAVIPVTEIPEPATLMFLAVSAGALLFRRR